MIKRLMHKLFLSCLKATELIEKKLRFRLSFGEKLQLTVHKMMCNACTQYEKQSILMEKGIEAHGKKIYYEPDVDELKKLVRQKLEHQGN
ncbi:MAG: hypothetical protein GXO83_05815 [Chlorobi bacterium]|nr:hypothetical protein [Chlorobiota bacterium]